MDEKRPLKFWLQRVKWEALSQGRFDGTLFPARIPLPMKLSLLDSCFGPFISGYGAESRPISSLAKLVLSDERILSIGMHPSDALIQKTGINQVNIVSLAEDAEGAPMPYPVRACCENRWWCVSFTIGAVVPDVEEPEMEHTSRGYALLELLGKPDYILTAQNETTFESALRRGAGTLRYQLVYQREEYALVFCVTDTVRPEMELATLGIGSCLYYGRPLWERDRMGMRLVMSLDGKERYL